jgi:hypothetical protein
MSRPEIGVHEQHATVSGSVVAARREEVAAMGKAPVVAPSRSEGEEAMNQVSTAPEALVVTAVNVALIEGATQDLADFGEEPVARGHRPSWAYAQVPDGWALCVGCWRPIAARQLGAELCPGPRTLEA